MPTPAIPHDPATTNNTPITTTCCSSCFRSARTSSPTPGRRPTTRSTSISAPAASPADPDGSSTCSASPAYACKTQLTVTNKAPTTTADLCKISRTHLCTPTSTPTVAHYAWTRVIAWLRRKHRRITWKDLRRRYCGGGWWPSGEELSLFDLGSLSTTRYRYRGDKGIPSPWPITE